MTLHGRHLRGLSIVALVWAHLACGDASVAGGDVADSQFEQGLALTIPVPPGAAEAKILSVSALRSDANLPSNVLDRDLSTRWSGEGVGTFITADLGSTTTTTGVSVAWYRGNARRSNYVISVSNDGASFGVVKQGQSSGSTTDFELYTFPAVSARYVRVTVNGNTENDWASVTELAVWKPSAPAPVPVAPDLWSADLSKVPIGFVPSSTSPLPGFDADTWDISNGGKVDVQLGVDGATKAYRSSFIASTLKQRAEQVPTYDPGGQGTIFWLGFDLSIPVWSTPTAWGPLVMQLKRDGLGNGPASINVHNGRMWLEGASGTGANGGSLIDLGPIPAAGSKARIVMGFYLHPTNGWIEGWRDGVLKARVDPWISKDTSSDGPGNVGSTLTGGVGVYLKLGGYRGGGPALDLRYSDMRAATTRGGVM